ncbi:MAG: glycosyltransferase family 4 protein [Candidatus Sungiibacteriota bacterium]
MKICFFTHNLRQDNGTGVFSRRLITGIRDALSADVIVLTAVSSNEPYEQSILLSNKLLLITRIPQIRAIMRDCDVVHALDVFPYGMIAAFASVGLRKKMIITTIGSGSILPLYHWLYAPFARAVYRQANAITAISAFTRDEILRKMPDLNIAVINPGVDVHEFSQHLSAIRDGANDAIKKFTPYILSVGQLRWRKGYHFSIRAFAKVSSSFPQLHYVIVGKRYTKIYERRLENLIEELGLQNRVHILQDVDSREALVEFYKNAGLFCLFSQNINHDVEGFGLVFLEAAAAGLPVVGSKDCGVDDAMKDGQNGILVAGRNPDDFADAIITILKDPAKKKAMADASRAFASEMSWQRQVSMYGACYRRIIAK